MTNENYETPQGQVYDPRQRTFEFIDEPESQTTQVQPRKRMSLTKKIGLGLAGLVTASALGLGGIYASVVIRENNYRRIDNIPYSKRTAEQEVFYENCSHWSGIDYGEETFEILIRLHPELKHSKIKELEKQGYVKEAVLFKEARINKMTVKAYQEYKKEELELLKKHRKEDSETPFDIRISNKLTQKQIAELHALKAKYQALK